LYENLVGIYFGDIEAPKGWITIIEWQKASLATRFFAFF
jgi:hypothetical protein